MKIENIAFNSLYCSLFQLLNRKSMFAATHSDINSLKSVLFHLTGQANDQKCRSAKVKFGIISESKFLGTVHRY